MIDRIDLILRNSCVSGQGRQARQISPKVPPAEKCRCSAVSRGWQWGISEIGWDDRGTAAQLKPYICRALAVQTLPHTCTVRFLRPYDKGSRMHIILLYWGQSRVKEVTQLARVPKEKAKAGFSAGVAFLNYRNYRKRSPGSYTVRLLTVSFSLALGKDDSNQGYLWANTR